MKGDYLLISLDDVDFMPGLEAAADKLIEMGLESREDKLPMLKEIVIACILFDRMMTRALFEQKCTNSEDVMRNHLHWRIKMSFSDTPPEVKPQGGSLYIDLNSSKTYRF